MLKKTIISLIAILAISTVAVADTKKNGIAVVNIDKVRMDTKAGKSIAQQMDDLQNKFKDKVTKMQQDFDSKKQELDKQKAVLSKEAFAKKETDFTNSLGEARKNLQKEAGDIEQMQQPALEEFNSIALNVISDIAKESHYLQVLPAALMIYSDPATDITSQVIAGIDKKVETIAVKAPAKTDTK